MAALLERVESRIESVPLASLSTAPPVAAMLLLSVSFTRFSVPELSTAPPRLAEPPVIVKPVMVAVTPLATVMTPTELPPLSVSAPVTGPTKASGVLVFVTPAVRPLP